MQNETITRFELARVEYLEIQALCETLDSERKQWYADHGLTRGNLAAWLIEHDHEDLPSDLRAIHEASCEAVQLRGDAYQALVDAARQITAVLIHQLNYKHVRIADLPLLFDHMARRPYSPVSRKTLDVILRLDVRR